MSVDFKDGLYRTCKWIQTVAGGATVMVPLTLKANPVEVQANFGSVFAGMLGWCQHWAWLTIPVAVATNRLAKLAATKLGDPTARDEIHKILDNMRTRIFSDATSPYQHHHRVTLFRYVSWAWVPRQWPWSGWLLPVQRSGHHAQKCKTYFRAPDDPKDTEGVAGRAWLTTKGAAVLGLPDLNSSHCTEAQVIDYAAQTGMSADWTRRNKPTGRSFIAIKVLANGKPWGVLVVDSRSETIDEKRVQKAFREEGSYLTFFGARL